MQYKELADMLGGDWNEQKVKNIARGVVMLPRDAAIKIAGLGGFNWEWFFEDGPPSLPAEWHSRRPILSVRELSSPLFPVPALTIPIPQWPAVPAGDWEAPTDSIDFYEIDPRIGSRGRIAAKIVGESMTPLLEQGDIAVFHLDQAPPIGSIVLARNGDREATVKVLEREGAEYVLRALNGGLTVKAREWEALGYLVARVRDRGPGDFEVLYRQGGLRP